jgi:hypothetical protein
MWQRCRSSQPASSPLSPLPCQLLRLLHHRAATRNAGTSAPPATAAGASTSGTTSARRTAARAAARATAALLPRWASGSSAAAQAATAAATAPAPTHPTPARSALQVRPCALPVTLLMVGDGTTHDHRQLRGLVLPPTHSQARAASASTSGTTSAAQLAASALAAASRCEPSVLPCYRTLGGSAASRHTAHAPASPAPQVTLWAMCGGMSSSAGQNAADPGLCCPAGSICNYYNRWWAAQLGLC